MIGNLGGIAQSAFNSLENLGDMGTGDNPGTRASEAASQIVDGLWEQIGNSNLYSGVLVVAKVFLGIGLLFILYRVYYQITENKIGDYRAIIAAFIWPIVAILLLVEPPTLTGQVVTKNTNVWNISLGFKNMIDTLDKVVVAGLQKDGKDPKIFLKNALDLESLMGEVNKQCNGIEDEDKYLACLKGAASIKPSDYGIDEVFAGATAGVSMNEEFNQLLQEAIEARKNAENGDNFAEASNLIQGLRNYPARVLTSWIDPVVNKLLTAFYTMFNLLIEISMLLVAAVAPIAIGMSLLPLQTRSLMVWLSGIATIGMTKISFHLITTMAAYFAFDNNYGGINTAIMILLGIGAPLIAGSVGTFSASGIQQGVSGFTNMMMLASLGSGGRMFGLGMLLGRK